MRRRPYIPLKVRLAVLERQAFTDRVFSREVDRKFCRDWYEANCKGYSVRARIVWLLAMMFKGMAVQLDHAPALSLRKISKRTGRYIPDANNPQFLVYRLAEDHLHKTVGRKPGAAVTVTSKGSDTWLAKKFRKLESKTKRPKRKIPSRPFSRARRSMAG